MLTLLSFVLSHVTTHILSKGRQFIIQDLLASKGLTDTEVQEGLIFERNSHPLRTLRFAQSVMKSLYTLANILSCLRLLMQLYVESFKFVEFYVAISFSFNIC